jgi:hypothetical protein
MSFSSTAAVHGQGLVEGFGLLLDVELLGDEVHAVGQGVDHEHVADGVGGHGHGHVVGQAQVDRLVALAAVGGVDPGHGGADLGQVVGVLGHALAARLEHGQEAHLAGQLGVVLQHGRERLEPADDVLGHVGAVDPQDQLAVLVPEGLGQGGGVLGHLGRVGQLADGGDVDRDRVVAGRHLPVADLHGHGLQAATASANSRLTAT